jgi:hypothetical protein
VIANEIRNESRRLSLTSVGGNDVNAVGRFVKAFARFVDRFGLAFDLCTERSLDDITDNGARMTVRRRRLARSVVNLNHGGLELITIQLRQGLRERNASSFPGPRSRVAARNLVRGPWTSEHHGPQNYRDADARSGSIHISIPLGLKPNLVVDH